jgi:uncharacterized paraquat-inducible protein A
MYPSLEYVLTKRYLVGVFLRCGALALFIMGAIPLLQMAVQIISDNTSSRIQMGIQRRLTTLELMLAYLPATLQYIVPAVVLLMFHDRMARWIAPLPRPRCPECGYWIRAGASPKCPECGSALPKALVERGEDK